MRLALMQPYYFPYIGYFDLAASCDTFVFYDDAAFSKNSWYNRNRILSANKPWEYVRVCVENAPLGTPASEVRLTAKDADARRTAALLNVYRRAPYAKEVAELVADATLGHGDRLADVAAASVTASCERIGLTPTFERSSAIAYDREGSAQDKVLSICRQLGATEYVNLSGGLDLYDPIAFAEQGVRLCFTPPVGLAYETGGLAFIPNLSIIDVMMWMSPESIRTWLLSRSANCA